MKTTLPSLLATVLLGFTLASCATAEPAQSPATSVTPVSKVKAKAYPLNTCIVTDNDLDSMGGEIVKTYDGQQIKFCCKPCVKKFEANPAKYLKKLK